MSTEEGPQASQKTDTATDIAHRPSDTESPTRSNWLRAVRSGDLDSAVAAYRISGRGDSESLRHAVNDLLDIRRQYVAQIGDHEAFVRRSPSGSLRQVIRPVSLSREGGHLYRVVKRVKVHEGSTRPYRRRDTGRWEWIEQYPEGNTHHLTYAGYLAINGVAGCSVGMPPTVVVDGVTHENPYVIRSEPAKPGMPGEPVRIIVCVIVVGPAPATGNPVAIRYVLDYEPIRDLQAALINLIDTYGDQKDNDSGSGYESVMVLPTEAWDDFRESLDKRHKWRWSYIPLHSGMIIAFDTRDKRVIQVQQSYVSLLQNAHKKATTVAQRNAMRQHPALGQYQSVVANKDGVARLGVIGWAASDDSMDQYRRILENMSRGVPMPSDVRLIESDDTYEIDAGDTAASKDADIEHVAAETESSEMSEDEKRDIERRERHAALIDEVDRLNIDGAIPDELADEASRASSLTVEELDDLIARINTPDPDLV